MHKVRAWRVHGACMVHGAWCMVCAWCVYRWHGSRVRKRILASAWAAVLMHMGTGSRGQRGGEEDLGICTPAEEAVARLARRQSGLHVGGGRGGARAFEHDLLVDDLEHDEMRPPLAELANLGCRRRLQREGEPRRLDLAGLWLWLRLKLNSWPGYG